MDAITLLTACKEAGITFYTGVPDSQLKGLWTPSMTCTACMASGTW